MPIENTIIETIKGIFPFEGIDYRYSEEVFFNKKEEAIELAKRKNIIIKLDILCPLFLSCFAHHSENKNFILIKYNGDYKQLINENKENVFILCGSSESVQNTLIDLCDSRNARNTIIVAGPHQHNLKLFRGYKNIHKIANDSYNVIDAEKYLKHHSNIANPIKLEAIIKQLSNLEYINNDILKSLVREASGSGDKILFSSLELPYDSLTRDYTIEEANVDVGSGYRDFYSIVSKEINNHNPLKNSFILCTKNNKGSAFQSFFGPNDLTCHDKITGNCSYEKMFENDCVRVNLKAKENPFL